MSTRKSKITHWMTVVLLMASGFLISIIFRMLADMYHVSDVVGALVWGIFLLAWLKFCWYMLDPWWER